MKTTIVKSLMAFLMCSFLFTACSSDEEPSVKELSGEEMVKHMNSVLNSNLDKMYGNATFDQFLLPVKNVAAAREVVKEIIREKWNGQDYTFQMPDKYGHIRIVQGAEEGVYYTLTFDVVNRKPFNFQLCTPGYPANENLAHSLSHISDSWQFR